MGLTFISIILLYIVDKLSRTTTIPKTDLRTQQLTHHKMCRVCAASSSSSYSSNNNKDGIGKARASGDAVQQTYCQACFDRMERVIRNHYQQLVQQTTDEGLSMCWPRLELIKAREDLRKAEEKELMALRKLSGM